MENGTLSDPSKINKKLIDDGSAINSLKFEQSCSNIKVVVKDENTARDILVELGESVVDSTKSQQGPIVCGQSNLELICHCNVERPSAAETLYLDEMSASSSFVNISMDDMSAASSYVSMATNGSAVSGLAMEGPSDEDSCYQLNNSWPPGDQIHCMTMNPSSDLLPSEYERCNISPLIWGGRVVGRRQVKGSLQQQCGMSREDFDSFVNIFEGGSVLYCNMSFEALLNVRKHLEEMDFPCKAVNDGLWLQVFC